jgi:hypothetical protein
MLTETLTCAELSAGDNINSSAGTMDKRQDFESMIFSARMRSALPRDFL